MVPRLTYQALEDHKAKLQKLKQLDQAIERSYSAPGNKGALQRAYLEKQKQAIRSTFPKPTLVRHD